MAFNGAIRLTQAGKALLAAAQTGGKLQYVRFVLGDGDPLGDLPPNVVSPKASIPIAGISRDGLAQVILRGSFKNVALAEAFVWHEFGLYATGGTVEEQVLFSYGYDPAGETIVDAGSGLVDKMFRYTSKIDDAENVSIVVDTNVTGITEGQLYAAIDGMLRRVVEAVLTVPAGGWTEDADGYFRKTLPLQGMTPGRGVMLEPAEAWKGKITLVDALRRENGLILLSEEPYDFPFLLNALVFEAFASLGRG